MPTIAVINTSVETTEVLQAVLEDEGYTTVAAYIVDFKRNPDTMTAFFHAHQPVAVVYDIALPYAENWFFFQQQVLLQSGLPESRFIVTTTNQRVLEELVGPVRTIELVGRPFDLDLVVATVHRAVGVLPQSPI